MSTESYCRSQLKHAIAEVDVPLVEVLKFREISLKILDGGDSSILLGYCPWCGTKLPASLRDEWFKELAARNIDPHYDEIPPEFQDAAWYLGRF